MIHQEMSDHKDIKSYIPTDPIPKRCKRMQNQTSKQTNHSSPLCLLKFENKKIRIKKVQVKKELGKK